MSNESRVEQLREFMDKLQVWAEDDSKRFQKAANDLGRRALDAAIAGRKGGYASALRDIFENPEKFGFLAASTGASGEDVWVKNLYILRENLEASKRDTDKRRRNILVETYEDIISIFEARQRGEIVYPDNVQKVYDHINDKSSSIEVNKESPDCSQHKKEILGVSDMKVLAEMIGDLHYETLLDLMQCLENKLLSDAKKDFKAGRVKLSRELREAGYAIESAGIFISHAWDISKPFMPPNNTPTVSNNEK